MLSESFEIREVTTPPPVRLDLRRAELTVAGSTRHLPPKTLDVLRALVEHAGDLVTREDLVRVAWGGLTVSTDAVRYTMRQVRVALADPAENPRFLETVARSGWRFVGGVERDGIDGWILTPAAERGAGSDRSTRPRLVGRDVEIERLRAALRAARSERCQTVFVTGEAGIGKTALVEDFLETATASGDLVVAHGECIEYHGAGQPYLPLLEALESVCTALGGDLPTAILRRHAPTWLAQLPSLTESEERELLARQIQGATQARVIRELVHALEQLSGLRDLVLWLDDLHWADDSTLEAVAYLARRLEGRGVLLIASLRPAETVGSASRFDAMLEELRGAADCRFITPRRLDAEAIRTYLIQRFGAESGPARSADLVGSLLGVSGGNPLFAVSVVADLVDRNVIRTDATGWRLESPAELSRVPDRIGPLLRRQIDGLRPEERELLEVASVAGLEFSVLELMASLDQPLDRLEELCDRLVEDGRFVRAAGSVGWPDGSLGSRYRFVHALHREALLGRLSPGRRSRIHRSIALRKQQGYAERVDEIAAELALHFERGLDPLRAIEYMTRAGDASARRFANREATKLFRQALALVPELPEVLRAASETRLRLALCAPLAASEGYATPELAANLARLAHLTRDVEDSPELIPILLGLWSLTLVQGDLGASAALGDRLLALAERSADPIVRMQSHRAVGHCLFYQGQLVASQRHLELALEGYDTAAHGRLDYFVGDDPVVLVHAYRGWSCWFHGFPDRAVAEVAEAVRQGERLAHPPSLAFALSYGSIVQLLRGEVGLAWDWSERSGELARQEGMDLWIALSEIVRGWCLVHDEDTRAGIDLLRRGLAGWAATGSLLGRPFFDGLLAEALGQAGEHDLALSVIAGIDPMIERTGQRIFRSETHRIEGVLRCHRALGEADFREGLAALERAVREAREDEALSLELRAALSLAELLEAQGQGEDGEQALRSCLARLNEGFADRDPRRAAAWLAARA